MTIHSRRLPRTPTGPCHFCRKAATHQLRITGEGGEVLIVNRCEAHKKERLIVHTGDDRILGADYLPRNEALEKFRTRWRRWLGNKCRANKPDWTTLLDTNWAGWLDQVYGDEIIQANLHSPREQIKAVWLEAINRADMEQLRRLDSIYATFRWKL
jgi:hypothetical protein